MDYVILIEPNEPVASAWSRDAQGQWSEQRIHGLDAKIDMPGLGIALTMAAIYESVEFPAGPRLVGGEAGEGRR
jgi:hypothetical protein